LIHYYCYFIGLEIDERDEVLLLRQRDCQAMQITAEIDRNPRAGGLDHVKALSQPGKLEKAMKKAMPKEKDVAPEDVQLIKNKSERMMSFEIAKAHRILLSSKGNPREEMKAFAIFENAAKRGNAEGLYNVSLMYQRGQAGLTRDLLKAREYCLKAASQKPYVKFQGQIFKNVGVAEAETSIAINYRDGLGVDQNDDTAFQWFLKSAQHGCSSGQNNLALALQNGTGCIQNLTSARAWFEQAVDSDQAEAQFNLASMLIKGQGGPVDTARAAELLKAAADQGLPHALAALQRLMRSGAAGVRAMSESKKVVVEKAKKEDPEAIFLLGLNYLNGTGGFAEDRQEAEKYLRLASQLNHPHADLILGQLLLNLAKNEDAFHFITRAAEIGGEPEAQWLLGTLYAYGQGCERDSVKGRKWLLRAKRQGYKGNDKEELSGGVEKKDVNAIIELGKKLEELESSKKLSKNGLKLADRVERLAVGMVDEVNLPIVKEALSFSRKGREKPPTPNVSSIKEEITEWMPEMIERAQNGSKSAQNFFRSMEMIEEAEEFMNNKQFERCFRHLRESYRVWDLPLIDVPTRKAFFRAAKGVLDTDPQNGEALFIVLKYHIGEKFDGQDQLSLAKHCTALDPTVADFHHLLGCIYGFRQEFSEAVRCLERALELNPQPEWLYDLASSMRLLPGSTI
jgi:TPR repeat protein